MMFKPSRLSGLRVQVSQGALFKSNNCMGVLMEERHNKYKYPIAMTQQFKHCGNPFRVDTYKGCDFGCIYCFANNRGGNFQNISLQSDMDVIKKYFVKAFETQNETKNLTVELLRHRVPLHLGGMSDPFQKREFKEHVTLDFLELTNKYRYPVLISTKVASLPDEYWGVLDNKIHAFQISLISTDDEFIRKYERNTPSATERIEFIKKLKDMGFWVGVRLQPLVDVTHAYELVKQISGIVDYITVEHIKIGNDNANKHMLFQRLGLAPEQFKSIGREYELKTPIKKHNIELLKSVSKCPIGCGDNDLHEMSDTNNCCGVDTIGGAFENWIKYNSMYINKTGDSTGWYPSSNCSSCFNSECRVKGWGFRDYVDAYMKTPIKEGECKVVL